MMNYIPCSADCFYQDDGLCGLNYAASTNAQIGATNLRNGCIHYIPRARTLKAVQSHGALHRYSAQEPTSDRPLNPNDPSAVWE